MPNLSFLFSYNLVEFFFPSFLASSTFFSCFSLAIYLLSGGFFLSSFFYKFTFYFFHIVFFLFFLSSLPFFFSCQIALILFLSCYVSGLSASFPRLYRVSSFEFRLGDLGRARNGAECVSFFFLFTALCVSVCPCVRVRVPLTTNQPDTYPSLLFYLVLFLFTFWCVK